MTQETKQSSITMTNRAPVRIRDSEWPTIASSTGDSYKGGDNAGRQQALARGDCDKYLLRVRQHADGRTLVYGVLDPAKSAGGEDRKGGELLDAGADIPAAIRRVGEYCGLPESVIRKCIGGLPAEEI